ncbi:LiaI-LiaF-like domain-containing protein [Mucilaginibacter sp.]|uniref:LiaI-LiaF-like domain-containing protein n=1 Tax=Mucilaginibacter sp. TaxID=1882438 RepID=UPI003D107191
MKNDKLIPGIILVAIGAAILLANYGYLHFQWYNIFRLWPIILVIAGVNLVFAHNKSHWATILKASVLVIGLGLLFFGNFGNKYNFWPGSHFNFNHNNNNNDDNSFTFDDDNDNNSDDNDKGDVKTSGSGVFNQVFDASTKYARLNISGGGVSYNLADTTNQLFNAVTKDSQSRYSFSNSKDDSVSVVDFKMKNKRGFNFDSDKNQVDFRLNPNPIWDINVETGATSLDFDLSKFKVQHLKLHGGAASFNVKLGTPLSLTDVDISTGVSSVEISIPENAACSIETNSGLSDNHYDGFSKTSDNNYETPGFATAKNKIHIHISGGLSDFKVSRY